MKSYTEAEKCMLLLFAPLMGEKPLSAAEFQRMEQTLGAIGPDTAAPDGDVTEQTLVRLGLSSEEAASVLSRLGQGAALERQLKLLAGRGIVPITRISAEYPRRLLEKLGRRAPMVLYCAGDLGLFQEECISLVGSRRLRPKGTAFARELGETAAREGLCYVSGGAVGADSVGFSGAMAQGGKAILFLPDSLLARMKKLKGELDAGRVLLVSEYGYALNFSVQRAYSRNRLIHAMGEKTFVAQADYGKGGTWNGVMENLQKGWSPVFVCGDEPEDPGTRGLLDRGCGSVLTAELEGLRTLAAAQMGLF